MHTFVVRSLEYSFFLSSDIDRSGLFLIFLTIINNTRVKIKNINNEREVKEI